MTTHVKMEFVKLCRLKVTIKGWNKLFMLIIFLHHMNLEFAHFFQTEYDELVNNKTFTSYMNIVYTSNIKQDIRGDSKDSHWLNFRSPTGSSGDVDQPLSFILGLGCEQPGAVSVKHSE